MSNTQWIWRYAKKNRGKIILAVLFLVINAALIIVNPYLGGMVIDDVINQQKTHLLIPLLLIMIATTVIRTIVRYSYQILFERVGQNTLYGKICIRSCKNWISTFSITLVWEILWHG